MALVGNMLAIQGGPSIINYDMFVAVFCMLALFYLTLVSVKESFAIHPIFPLVLDALCTLFTLIAGIATAAYLKVHSCSNRVSTIGYPSESSRLTPFAGLPQLQHCHPRICHSLP
jgi:tetrahydromethanopterin S-methyltransferase subunit E